MTRKERKCQQKLNLVPGVCPEQRVGERAHSLGTRPCAIQLRQNGHDVSNSTESSVKNYNSVKWPSTRGRQERYGWLTSNLNI